MKKVLILALIFFLFSPPATIRGGEIAFISKAYSFLKAMYVPEIGLLREYWGSKRCWLYNDNYLAYKILSRQKEYLELTRNIERVFDNYKVSLEGNGRLEVLFDQIIEFPPKVGESFYLDYRDGFSIFTENAKMSPLDWDEYGDLLLYGTIDESRKGNKDYQSLWIRAKDMFDGFGIRDRVAIATGKYETYKLALFLFTANLLKDDSIDREKIIGILSKLQDEDGGFVTHYDKNSNWLGFSNVETTCFVILALESCNWNSLD
ncbi:hypothetical protein H5T89_06045 [bacterium]|nr:hypothetical protein [bacterium]